MQKIIDSFQTLGIIGLAKNSGKTTTLNYMLRLFDREKIALTSIGLDGEELDQINFLPKPRVCVKKGMVVATAEACLKDCDIEFKVLMKTKLFTSLGPIKIIEILSEGHLVIAGPTSNTDLKSLISWIKPYADKIFIDGAFNRMTFTSIDLIDGIVLASGAAVHPLMNKTVEKTKAIVDAFASKRSSLYNKHPQVMMAIHTKDNVFIFRQKNYESYHKAVVSHRNEIKAIYIKGAITPRMIDILIDEHIRNITLICDDPTKLLISENYFEYIKKLGIEINVIQSCKIVCVTTNPFSPNGLSYDATTFLNAMKEVIDLPVFDVKLLEVQREQT